MKRQKGSASERWGSVERAAHRLRRWMPAAAAVISIAANSVMILSK